MNIDEVIDKIKKAVRLANRTTEAGERETALRLARSLAERNGVAFDDIKAEESDADKAVLDEDDGWRMNVGGVELGFACYILKHHFGVILMVSPHRDNPRSKRLSWIGSHLNIDIAKHVYHILMRECRKAWREASAPQRKLRRDLVRTGALTRAEANALVRRGDFRDVAPTVKRDAFMQGFFWAISQKLAANPLRNDLERDIAAAERKLLAFRDEQSVREAKNKTVKADANSLLAGVEAARAVNLARPCEGRDAGTGARFALTA